MNAYAIKAPLPFATNKTLARTPLSDENKKIADFINTHNFSFDIDEKTGELKSTIRKNNENKKTTF